mgnify:CR=1 FL=1
MPTKVKVTQYTLTGDLRQRTHFHWAPGEFYAAIEARRRTVEIHKCETCDRVLVGKAAIPFGYYDPWTPLGAAEPDYVDWQCANCLESGVLYGWSDFGPEWCERCGRDVIQRCPSNGWRGYFVDDPEFHDGMCCVGCAHHYYLEYGHTEEQIRRGQADVCDFYSSDELTEAGFVEGETFYGSELAEGRARKWREYCAAKLTAGYICVTDQGSTGLGNGYPDWVTVWTKLVNGKTGGE